MHSRDRAETAKILKFKKKASDESDEDFKAEAEATWKKIDSVNTLTKNISVFQGRIRSAVEDCFKTHNNSVIKADSRRRVAMMKDLNAPPPPQARKRKVIAGLDDDADEADSHPPPPQCKIVRLPTPRSSPPATEAVPPAPPQAPTPPRAPTPPAAEPSLNDNFPPQHSPPARAEPAASKDYSSAKSNDSDDNDDE